jgi:hypothetical protein
LGGVAQCHLGVPLHHLQQHGVRRLVPGQTGPGGEAKQHDAGSEKTLCIVGTISSWPDYTVISGRFIL